MVNLGRDLPLTLGKNPEQGVNSVCFFIDWRGGSINLSDLPEIVNDATIVTLLGAGPAEYRDLQEALAVAPALIALDGGVDRALDWGVTPRAVVGDLDSANLPRALAAGVPAFEAEDQNLTDLEKALALLPGSTAAIAVGCLGGRLDHELAAMTAIGRARQPVLLLGAVDAAAMLRGPLSLDLPVGTRLSLWPLTRARGVCRGLRWPIAGLSLDPLGRIGCSNEVSETPAEIAPLGGEMLVIVPRAHLRALLRAVAPGAGDRQAHP